MRFMRFIDRRRLYCIALVSIIMSMSKITFGLKAMSRRALTTLVSKRLHLPHRHLLQPQITLFSSASEFPVASSHSKVDHLSESIKKEGIDFGEYHLIASQGFESRSFTPINALGTTSGPAIGSKVWLRGRVTSLRAKGNACFLVLRDSPFATVQACHFKVKGDEANVSKQLLKFASNVTLETIVDIYGTVVSADVKACSQSNVEVQMDKLFIVSAAPATLPFLLEDAARSQADIDASLSTDRPFAGVSPDVRYNNRWLDLRTPVSNAVIRIRGGVSLLFREALTQKGFVEINTPKLIGGESEGGSEVFRTDYFGQPACLAQSPQLYKQMCISADLDRVFEIGPVFRAEKSMTRRHLCEFTGLDIEMAVQSHYHEAIGVLHHVFRHIFSQLEERYAPLLSIIREHHPSSPAVIPPTPFILPYPRAIEMLRSKGEQIGDYDDFSTAQEILLGQMVKEAHGVDFYAIDQFPSALRPFYTMPNQTNTAYSNSYDLYLRGQEICSGAQRVHDPEMLLSRILAKGLDPTPLTPYINSFTHACPPHAGGGVGLDRVVYLYLGLDNVRKATLFPRDPNRLHP